MTQNPESLNWQKSSFSGGGDGNSCIELAAVTGSFLLRESEDPKIIVTTTSTPLAQLLQAVRRGLIDGNQP